MTTPSKAAHATTPPRNKTSTASEPAATAADATAVAASSDTAATSTKTSFIDQWKPLAFMLGVSVAAVFPISIGVGTAFLKASTSTSDVPATTIQQHDPEPEEAPRISKVTVDRKIGDQLFEDRRYEVALNYYRTFSGPKTERLPPELSYRIALCQESLGHWEEALEGFRVVSDVTENALLKAVSLFAQARLLMRLHEPERAVTVLRSLIFRTGGFDSLPEELIQEIEFLLPLAQAQETVTAEQPANYRSQTSSLTGALDWPLAPSLRWIEKPVATEIPNSLASTSDDRIICRVKKPTIEASDHLSWETWKCDISSNGQTLRSILERLARECDWNLELSNIPGARTLDRSVHLNASNLSVYWVLASICSELNLTWSLEENQLKLFRFEHADSQSRQMISRTLTTAIADAPTHRQVGHAKFALAQLIELDGHFTEAADAFSLLVSIDSSPLSVRAAYSAAVNYIRVHDYAQASKRLDYAVAAAPEGELSVESLLLYGRLLLDNGEARSAVYQFRRAAQPRNRPVDQARAAVLLGLSLLAEEKFHEAAEAILAHKNQFHDSSVRNAAAFVTSFARWRALTPDRREREAPYLYRSVLSVKLNSDWLGLTGKVYIGRALAELGFDEQIAEIYSEIPRQNIPSNISHPIDFELADYEFQNGHPEKAEEIWKQLAADTEDIWANRARLKLVELAFSAGKFDESLEASQLLLNRSGVDSREIKKLIGRIYEAMGDNDRAAKSYAGQIRSN